MNLIQTLRWLASDERRWLRNFRRQQPAFEKAETEFLDYIKSTRKENEPPRHAPVSDAQKLKIAEMQEKYRKR